MDALRTAGNAGLVSPTGPVGVPVFVGSSTPRSSWRCLARGGPSTGFFATFFSIVWLFDSALAG